MSSIVAIWAAAVATVDTVVKVGVIFTGAATPGMAPKTAGVVADDHDGAAAAAGDGPDGARAASAAKTASATGAAR